MSRALIINKIFFIFQKLERMEYFLWTRSGSNRPPLQCECSALPDELRAQSPYFTTLLRILPRRRTYLATSPLSLLLRSAGSQAGGRDVVHAGWLRCS